MVRVVHRLHTHRGRKSTIFKGEILKQQFADDQPPEVEWEKLHEVADDHQEETQGALMTATRAVRNAFVMSAFIDAFERGDLSGALAAVPLDQFEQELTQPMRDQFIDVLREAGQESIGFLPEEIQAELDFDLLNEHSVEFIREHTAELIDDITTQSEEAIRDVIDRAFEDGIHPRRAAREIREVIGLDSRSAQAVDNLRRRLRADDVPWTQVEEQISQYTDRLLDQRAERIARTETMKAANAGQQLAWEQAEEQGLITEAETRREWIVTPDDRLCEFCEPLDGITVGLHDNFPSEIGSVDTPPLHPNCRCAVALVFTDR